MNLHWQLILVNLPHELILMNLPWWADIDKSFPLSSYGQIYPIESLLTNAHWHDNVSMNLPLWLTSTNLSWQVNIDKSTLLSWYWWIYSIESISTGIHWKVNIDESMRSNQHQLIYMMGWYQWIYHWFDIYKSTLGDCFWWIFTDELISTMYLRNQY